MSTSTTTKAPNSAAWKILNFKVFEKNTLKAFFDVQMGSGMIVRECSLHERDGARWVNLPSRKFTGKDGEPAYAKLVEFVSREVADAFRDRVIQTIDAMEGAASPPPQPSPKPATARTAAAPAPPQTRAATTKPTPAEFPPWMDDNERRSR
jgi:DNA-binding cell septation regulator SpoVG